MFVDCKTLSSIAPQKCVCESHFLEAKDDKLIPELLFRSLIHDSTANKSRLPQTGIVFFARMVRLSMTLCMPLA